MTFPMTRHEFAAYLDSARITGDVATPRENNLSHIQGFLDHNEHLEFGVIWSKDWTYDEVFEVMVRRAGLNPDRSHVQGQDTIGAAQCIDALEEYACIFGDAVRARQKILFATGHPAGLFPIYAELARVAERAGATVLRIEQGERFLDGDIRQIMGVVMFEQTLMGRMDEKGNLVLDELNIDDSVLRSIDKIIVVACGTAAYAGQVARYAIEHWCRIPTEVELAHEFRYRDPIVNEKTLIVALSQSGETMDTLMAVRHAREQGAKVISICNTHGSTLPRESDAALYTHAGPEIAVASTKAFLAQITAAYLLGLYLAQLRGNKYKDEISAILGELQKMPAKIQKVIDNDTLVKELGAEMKDTSSVIFLGRHVGFPVALEGALKLKEISYIHAEGFAAGELKHGPIALIEEGQPVIIIVPSAQGRESLHGKVVSNIQEVRARGAFTIVIAEEGDEAVKDYADRLITVPAAPSLLQPLLATVPLQIFACALAEAKGLDVDQPRNLAKSVTVE